MSKSIFVERAADRKDRSEKRGKRDPRLSENSKKKLCGKRATLDEREREREKVILRGTRSTNCKESRGHKNARHP